MTANQPELISLTPRPANRALLRERDYLLFWSARFTSVFGSQVQSIAMGWQVYVIARHAHSVEESALWVGFVGLATFVPIFLLALPAGEAADRHDRKAILRLCTIGQLLSALLLALASWRNWASIPLLLLGSALFGGLRAYSNPATGALGPMMVSRALLPRAIAWNSLALQGARIAGPAAGGLLVAVSPAYAYAGALGLYLTAVVSVGLIRTNARPDATPGSRWTLMREGVVYVWRHKVVFGAISLDLFAVLLGGASALLPVFARDVLHVGAQGFGLLRSAPAIGATLVGLALAAAPVRRKAGLWMFGSVALFGTATIVFSLSNAVWLSVAALAVLGGADMFSVFVRQTLIQLTTPDAMRGRVAAVAALFVGASNELGEFESGVVARFTGPVIGVLVGGVGALAVSGIWAVLFPALRKADSLE